MEPQTPHQVWEVRQVRPVSFLLWEIDSIEPKGIDLSMQLREWIRTVTHKFLSKNEDLTDSFFFMENEVFIRERQKAFSPIFL